MLLFVALFASYVLTFLFADFWLQPGQIRHANVGDEYIPWRTHKAYAIVGLGKDEKGY